MFLHLIRRLISFILLRFLTCIKHISYLQQAAEIAGCNMKGNLLAWYANFRNLRNESNLKRISEIVWENRRMRLSFSFHNFVATDWS
jgi:phosphorylcholine metabolism protein LicD